jgi:hypothetical protein
LFVKASRGRCTVILKIEQNFYWLLMNVSYNEQADERNQFIGLFILAMNLADDNPLMMGIYGKAASTG